MRILQFFCLTFLSTLVVLNAPKTIAKDYVLRQENVLGTSLELRIETDSEKLAERIEKTSLQEIDRLSQILSRHHSDSELMQWQAEKNDTQALSVDLRTVIKNAERWRQLTNGAFDIRAGAFASLWSQAEQNQKLPAEDNRRKLALTVRNAPWTENSTGLVNRNDKLPLSLDALAKGYILDSVCKTIQKQYPQLSSFTINIGGDLRKFGKQSLNVSISNPDDASEHALPVMTFNLTGPLALATSGGYQRYVEIAGRKYSHIIDPRTGFPANKVQSASVIAPTAMDADAAATTLCVLGSTEGLSLIESLDGFECFMVADNGKTMVSSGWPTGNSKWETALINAQKNEKTNSKSNSGLHIDFSLSRPQGGRYRRPYVAVWLEDADGFPVKTAVLWMQTAPPGPRWHRDLTRWYRNDRLRKLAEKKEMIGTISGATRGPGKYRARFDGTDNLGKPLPHGKYTLYIEAAREHGTYQIIRKTLELGNKPISKQSLKDNVEISETSFEYIPWSTK